MHACFDSEPINVSMIGPFPRSWGGRTSGGGVATHVQNLVTTLPNYKVNLRVLADNTNAARPVQIPEVENKVDIQYMIRPSGLSALPNLLQLSPRVVGATLKFLMHPRLLKSAPMSYNLKFIGHAANFDSFLSNTQTDLLHVHHAEFRFYICQQVLGIEKPLIATVHGVTNVVGTYPDWLVSLIKTNYQRANRLIAVSNYVKEVLVKHGADPNRVTVIPNGVNVNVFAPFPTHKARDQLGLPIDRFIVLFVGNLKPWKGVDVLLQAFRQCVAKHSHMYLIIVGTGPERDNLGHLVNQLGITERVMFAGYKSFVEMPLWYQACDVLVLPSRAEGFGLAALEAMSCGKPVVVSFPPLGDHNAVKQNETGLLVEYGDVDQLAHILDCLVSSPTLRDRLGANARRLVRSEFSWEMIAYRTVEIYHSVLNDRKQ
jgi:glycosyltransferase involved in cell wall biosynthesis